MVARSGVAHLDTKRIAWLDGEFDLVVGAEPGVTDAVGHQFAHEQCDRLTDVEVEPVERRVVDRVARACRRSRVRA